MCQKLRDGIINDSLWPAEVQQIDKTLILQVIERPLEKY